MPTTWLLLSHHHCTPYFISAPLLHITLSTPCNILSYALFSPDGSMEFKRFFLEYLSFIAHYTDWKKQISLVIELLTNTIPFSMLSLLHFWTVMHHLLFFFVCLSVDVLLTIFTASLLFFFQKYCMCVDYSHSSKHNYSCFLKPNIPWNSQDLLWSSGAISVYSRTTKNMG